MIHKGPQPLACCWDSICFRSRHRTLRTGPSVSGINFGYYSSTRDGLFHTFSARVNQDNELAGSSQCWNGNVLYGEFDSL